MRTTRIGSHIDSPLVSEGEPLGPPLVHEDRVVDGVRQLPVERLWQVVAGGGAEHGDHSQPEVGTCSDWLEYFNLSTC